MHFFLFPAVVLLFITSMLSPTHVRSLQSLLFGLSLVLLLLTLFVGTDIKGHGAG